MHSLEREIRQLHAEGLLDDATASRAVALDRGEVFSIFAELRLALYAGVTLVTSGVGVLLARNLDRIGPLAIVLGVALAAAGCAVPAVRARLAGRPLSTAADYLLLLAVLLVSADLGYAEHQFQLLGPLWTWHFLLLAGFHAAVAYTFRSPLVLAAALTALSGFFGVGGRYFDAPFLDYSGVELGSRSLACAATIAAWRFVDSQRSRDTRFSDVFDHFAANLAFWGVLAWCYPMPWLLAGMPLLAAMSFLSIRHGLRTGRELYLVYGVVYGALGTCIAIVPRLGADRASAGFVLLVLCVAAAALWQLRQQIKESRS